jgi:hypothetical protein
MSKNLTRKGLALGAVVALGSSLFAGTPATAAPTAATLASAYGTSTTGVLGEYFYLSTLLTGGADNDALKYYVEGATAANLDARTRSVTDLSTSSATSTYVDRTSSIVAVDNAAKIATVTSPYTAGKYSQLAIKLGSGVTATTSLKITAFVDSQVADDKPTAGEIVSSAMTVSFVKDTELTVTPTIVSATVGSAVKSSVAVSNSVNLEQFRAAADGAVADSTAFSVKHSTNGAALASQVYVRWNKTDKEFVNATSGVTAAAATTYGVTAFLGALEKTAATAVTATTGEVTTLANVSFSGADTKASGGASGQIIRAGSGAFTLKSKVTGVSAGKLVGGQKVTFVIEEEGVNTLDSAATVTAGGKTLSNTSTTVAQKISVEVTSAADGSLSLPITYAGIKDTNKIKVIATTSPASGSTAITSDSGTAVVVQGQDSVATALVDPIESANNSAVRRIAKLGSVNVAFTLVDQFGQTPSGTFRAVVTSSGSSAGAPAITSPLAISGGKVTVTGTDTSTAAQTYTVSAAVQKLGTDGVTYGSTLFSSEAIAFNIDSVPTVGRLSISASVTTGVARAGDTLVAGNTDLEQSTVARSYSGSVTLTTTAYATSGAVAPGATVTLTAAGVLFKSANVYGLGSITVVAGANGETPAINLYSNNTGKQTITVTSGSVSKTQDITFATATTGGSSWTITSPKYILPGQTLKISGVLKDELGGVVDTAATVGSSVKPVKVVYTGPGYVTKDIATETDEDGVVSFTVLLGAGDTGSATVKFIYAGANNTIEETTANDDVVSSATITLGAAPVAGATAAIAGSTKRFIVSVSGNTGAKNVVVKVAGKTFRTLKGATAKKTYVVAAPKGSHKVTVFVGGKLIATKTISVK